MFLDVVGKYMAEGYVKFADGEISFGGQRIAFNFMPTMVREFLINSEISGDAYHAALFLAARREGYDFIKEHGIPLMKNWTPIIKMGFEWINLFGAGPFRSVKADNETGFMISAGVSSFGLEVKEERPCPEPVDFILNGLISGAIQYYTKSLTYAVETACVAQKGVQECVIVSGNRKNIMDYIRKFSPDKAEFGNRTLDQIEKVEKQLEDSGDKRWLF